jgi:hypothetical protein
MHRRRLVLLAALLMGLVLAVAPAGRASAVACTWATCTGKDPQAAGCSPTGRTVREFTSVGVRVELRYSSTCHAALTRATKPDACCNNHESQIRGYGTKATLLKIYYKQFPWDGTNWTPHDWRVQHDASLQGLRGVHRDARRSGLHDLVLALLRVGPAGPRSGAVGRWGVCLDEETDIVG